MLISKGSVKDLHLLDKEDELHFQFSDRVSVFDYGSIPEDIPGRGRALCDFAKIIFRDLAIPSAYLGDSSLGADALKMCKAAHPKFKLENKKLQFIPLEVIFRWGVPEGSKLLKKGYKPFEIFSAPMIEYTTKLEAFDRDLTEQEAQSLLPSSTSLQKINTFTSDVALKLKTYFNSCGLQLWDGKIEIAINDEGDLLLIDAITPDELRLTMADFPRIPLSKELLRRWYQKTLWPTELQKLKDEKGQSWRESAPPPPALGKWRVEKFSGLFLALTQVVKSKSPAALEKWVKEENAPSVFVAGNGGRETALKWKFKNEGCMLATSANEADAIFVSNDNDLAAGAIDTYVSEGRWAVGPTKNAAHVEWSKIFGKEVATLAKIPMAAWTTKFDEALKFPTLPVVKQDGLAAGKGVALPETPDELKKIVDEWKNFPLLFEERLSGEESSVFFWIHPKGDDFAVNFLGSAKDFKRRFDGDTGPNTGGMGAQSPHPTLTETDIAMCKTWAIDTARALRTKGIHYSGPLFMGLLRDAKKGWCLLEYNARFGDPETQALVLRWSNQNFLRSNVGLSLSENLDPELSAEKALCLALVHPKYPSAGEPISLTEWKTPELPAGYRSELFVTGSKVGRMAYLCLRGKEELGKLAANLMEKSPWAQVLEWRKDPLSGI
jgi:phosphoribosylaminoimidazole-succinocarboxamide synthase